MKYSIATLASTLALFANASLVYNAQSHTIACPSANGAFCVGAGSDLIVWCTGSVGTLSKCDAGTTCGQSSADAGDAKCSAASASASKNGTAIVDSVAGECDCEDEHPHPTSKSSYIPPLPPSSTPSSFSKFSNHSSTPVGPVIPSSTPCPPSSTPVGPAKVSSSSMHYGTGTSGMPKPTAQVTTLHSSWKPTLTPLSSSARPSSTIVSPSQQTTNAAAGNSVNAMAALGVFGLAAALL